MTDCPRAHGVKGVGRTCTCGEHPSLCPACGVEYLTWENPHYVPSVGHLTPICDSIEPYYTCTNETVPALSQRVPSGHNSACRSRTLGAGYLPDQEVGQ